MNIQQAVKMAWKSIWGKKGRSALTMLGIIIGIAAVMTIVSAINGYTEKTMGAGIHGQQQAHRQHLELPV
ncbi:MAG: ABC transporter permease [Dysosmobacter welbionis]